MAKDLTIDRRNFLEVAAVGAAGIFGAGALASCSAKSADSAKGDSPSSGTESGGTITPDETIEADVVVMGGGISGLSAAVQAAQLDMRVVLLERMEQLGGNGAGTEGIFGVNSTMQQEQGIKVTLADVVSSEIEFFNYKPNALLWKDMVDASADDIDWLAENGVVFSGVVDSYGSVGKVPTMHYWADHSAVNYIKPMGEKAGELGVDMRLSTRGAKLLMEDGKVAGIYADKADGSVLLVKAPAVILAAGGYAENMDKLASLGINTDLVSYIGMPGHEGDSIRMASEVGGFDVSLRSGYLRETSVAGCTPMDPACQFLMTDSTPIWVNQDGDRFVSEDCLHVTSGCVSNAHVNQDQTYAIISENLLADDQAGVVDNLNDLVANGSDQIVAASSVDELAEKLSISTEALSAAIERYNGFCETGVDEDFGKPAERMVKLAPPFWGLRLSYIYMTSIGGIHTSRHAEVLTCKNEVIPGLYAAGADGCALYWGTYTINIPGSFNGNNVYSGRNAARNAAAYIQK